MTKTKPTFNEWIDSLGFRPLSPQWSAIVKAILGEELTDADAVHYRKLSGGLEPPPPGEGLTRVLVVAGRRANKSETLARLAVYETLYGGHEDHLAPGEIGSFPIISPVREASQIILNYVKGLCAHKAIKAKLDGNPTNDEVRFRNGLSISVVSADGVSVRGKSLFGGALEEAAQLDAVKGHSSEEIISAVTPALQRMKGSPPRRLVSITTAFLKSGAAYKTWRDCHGVPGAAWTVFYGTSMDFNPSLEEADVAKEQADDPIKFAREYQSEWQDSISTDSYFGFQHIDAAVDKGRGSLPWVDGVRYVAAMDPALRNDAWALVVATHRTTAEGKNIVEVVHVESWSAPKGGTLDPSTVLQKIAYLLRSRYALKRAWSDQFHGASLRKLGSDYGLSITEKPWTGGGEESKALQYQKAHELMRTGGLRLPDDPRLLAELKSIRSKLLPSGIEQIQATGSGHDDLVSALVMAITECQKIAPTKAKGDMTPWEQREKEIRDQQTARMFGSAGAFGWR